MKRIRNIVFCVLAAACFALVAAGAETDYRDPANWAICETEARETEFDVFYVYPTLFADDANPLMRWRDDPGLRAKTIGFARAQAGIFGGKARVFAPFVRQLEYRRCVAVLTPERDWRDSEEFRPGVRDTQAALRHYLAHFNGGRPYILFGHSQGAIDLYLVMRSLPEVSPDRGFAAAYLIGLPKLTAPQIAADFAGRGIAPAAGRGDVGVVIGWNTQAPGVENPAFTGRGTFCINPLNWRTDGTPAGREENVEAFFYDYRTGKSRAAAKFCGAKIDVGRGALLVDLPVGGKYDAGGFMGKGVFHMNDVWFFAGNIRVNAAERVKKLLERAVSDRR